MEKKKYPIGKEYYILNEEIGNGVTASVHRALCIPFDEIVAIKIFDFERDNIDLNNISREVQTMILIDHPNVLKSHCSFVSDHNLWVVMPFMAGGSCLHILKAAYPDGFDEVIISTILREVLKGLEYLHNHGKIHRDVKAGNILIDARGAIKLGDFGVSACLYDSGDRQRMRNTFVGTPCWMAPEVMEQLHGYDVKADIWSFGITALELAHGHAPFSKYPPMKVLLMTLQNAPPCLDYERDDKFSKSFKQMIASCLVKDPSKRPFAKKLLKHPFFKQARSNDYILRTLLDALPSLGDRIKALKMKEEDMLAQKKMPDFEKEEISQNEYNRGISGWNFDLEDVKAQASLIQDVEDITSDNNLGGSSNFLQDKKHDPHIPSQEQVVEMEDNDTIQNNRVANSLMEFPECNTTWEKYEDESNISSAWFEQCLSHNGSIENDGERASFEIDDKPFEAVSFQRKMESGLGSLSFTETTIHPHRSKVRNNSQNSSTSSGPILSSDGDDVHFELLSSKTSKSLGVNREEVEEKTKASSIQQKGRFKVTSEDVDLEKVIKSPFLQKSQSMQVLGQHNTISTPQANDATIATNLSSCSLFHLLLSILQTNILQRDNILNLLKQVSTDESTEHANDEPQGISPEKSLLEATYDKEKELLNQVTDLQWRLLCAQEELQKYKTENAKV